MKDIVHTGFHSIEELLKQKKSEGILYYSRSSRRNSSIIDLAKRQGYRVLKASEAEIAKLAGGASHRGIAFVSSHESGANETKGFSSGRKTSIDLDSYLENLNSPNALVVILDGITDPHNLGAIIRSSDQFYADIVLIPSRNSARDNATVSRISAGADNYVNIDVITNLSRAMDKLKKSGFWIYGADMSGNSISKTDFTGRVVLVMGSEGKGLRDLTRSKCDNLVSIPAKGHVDSLNVSVAAGVMMYEIRRQQNLSS
ncbi:MAG: 23S rRNA (guanosine(2251)-2'-O)-methyltransferase RlmB [Spirochaetales bacterium]|nr:23S rRNA (guanosine(2251)-2'-O)-methyltransferase RlmB [Spirochaetales bacterium]